MSIDTIAQNYITDHVAAVLHAHALLICSVIGVSVVFAYVAAKFWPIPPPTAPKWKRVLHFIFVNWPLVGSSLNGRTVLGLPFSIPFLTWTRYVDQAAEAVEKAREILREQPGTTAAVVATKADDGAVAVASVEKKDGGFIDLAVLMFLGLLAFVVALLLTGCAPTDAYVTAVKVKGDLADTLYAAHEAWIAFDKIYHDDLVKGADTLADGRGKLEKWEVVEKKVDDAFVAARNAISAYSLALAAAGADEKKDYVAAIADVTASIAALVDLLRGLGVAIPGLDSTQKPTAANEVLVASATPPCRLAYPYSGRRLCVDPLWRARAALRGRVADLLVAVCAESHVARYYPRRACNYFQERVSR